MLPFSIEKHASKYFSGELYWVKTLTIPDINGIDWSVDVNFGGLKSCLSHHLSHKQIAMLSCYYNNIEITLILIFLINCNFLQTPPVASNLIVAIGNYT